MAGGTRASMSRQAEPAPTSAAWLSSDVEAAADGAAGAEWLDADAVEGASLPCPAAAPPLACAAPGSAPSSPGKAGPAACGATAGAPSRDGPAEAPAAPRLLGPRLRLADHAEKATDSAANASILPVPGEDAGFPAGASRTPIVRMPTVWPERSAAPRSSTRASKDRRASAVGLTSSNKARAARPSDLPTATASTSSSASASSCATRTGAAIPGQNPQ
mmetsp:Transcript_8119/g.31992  ORF Transcript_8119/g.31992 Transcript_8119/m.31992 type:complete len:218 (+) Transcript_8119:1176-1829(+)